MANVTTAVIGNQVVRAKENTETAGNFAASFNKMVSESGGAYDMMNTFKKVAILSQHPAATQLGMYVAGSAVPRLPAATYAFYKDIQRAKTEQMTVNLATKLTHGVFEVGAMSAFTIGFFSKNFQPFVNTGMVLNAASDVADVGTFATDIIEANNLLKQAKEASHSKEIISALEAKSNFSMLKLAKAVTGALTGFYASFTIMKGTMLVSSAVSVTISLASSLFNITAFHQKNFGSKYFAEIENPKVLKFA